MSHSANDAAGQEFSRDFAQGIVVSGVNAQHRMKVLRSASMSELPVLKVSAEISPNHQKDY
jgi:hypothetical protein